MSHTLNRWALYLKASTRCRLGPRLYYSRAYTPQNRLPAAYYRGGTSRAVIFRTQDLPTDRRQWDSVFRGVIGSPDPNGRQLDGMGGGISSLSKVCVVGPSTHPNADVDYTFAALDIRESIVDYSSNCGNLTSAIGPFAIDKGLATASTLAGNTTVRIHNTNTGKIIHSTFPVVDGEAVANGDFAIDGVAGTAAKIELAFIDPAGSKTGVLLPTGNVTDILDGVRATCIDAGNPCVFIQAQDVDFTGTDFMNDSSSVLKRLEKVRREAAVALGLCNHISQAPGSIPKLALVSAPKSHELQSGTMLEEKDVDLIVRALSMGQPHKAIPITVAMALAAAANLNGSTVQEQISSERVDPDGIVLGHPGGKIMVGAEFDVDGGLTQATVFRTARRLMDGLVYWK